MAPWATSAPKTCPPAEIIGTLSKRHNPRPIQEVKGQSGMRHNKFWVCKRTNHGGPPTPLAARRCIFLVLTSSSFPHRPCDGSPLP